MQLRDGTGFTSTKLNADAVGARVEQAERTARSRPHTKAWLTHLDGLARTTIVESSPKIALSTLRRRIDQKEMSDSGKVAFKAAVQKIANDGTYGALIAQHMDMSHNMHGSMGDIAMLRFLPWHRRYLVEFETKLQAADKILRPAAKDLVCIPYWSWPDPFPSWLEGFLPAADPDTGKPPPARQPGPPPEKPTAADIKLILTGFGKQMPNSQVNDYVRFTYGLEGWGDRPDGSSLPAHNHVHDWVGGVMSNTSTSPTDPVFWLHHAEVDRLWHIWQQANASAHPTLTGKDRIMDPWKESYDELVSIQNLGYSYDNAKA